jgi:hypothetical protein
LRELAKPHSCYGPHMVRNYTLSTVKFPATLHTLRLLVLKSFGCHQHDAEHFWQGKTGGRLWASFAHRAHPPKAFVSCDLGYPPLLGSYLILRSSNRKVYLENEQPGVHFAADSFIHPCNAFAATYAGGGTVVRRACSTAPHTASTVDVPIDVLDMLQ